MEEIAALGRSKWRVALPRLDAGTPGLRVLVAAGLLAALVAGMVAWRSRPVAEPIVQRPPAPAGVAVVAAEPSPSPTSSVIVYVSGKVRRPGVLTLATGSRVVDAIKAAGGVRKGASPGGVNLARRLVDGEQIVVGAAQPAGPGPGAAQAPTGDAVVSLNAATAEQLDALPGVGEVLAQRIVEFRDAHGGFQTVDQLREVSGIGEKKFADLRAKVTV